jgi:hypothetical protein
LPKPLTMVAPALNTAPSQVPTVGAILESSAWPTPDFPTDKLTAVLVDNEAPRISVIRLTPLQVSENTTVRVEGNLLEMTSDILLEAQSIPFTLHSVNTSSTKRRLLAVSWLEFRVPAMRVSATTETLSVEIVACNRQCTVQSGSVVLLYSTSPCLAGELEIDADAARRSERCGPCPTGGHCPGGGVVWPLPGYWSTDAFSAPLPCAFPKACPGVNLETANGGGTFDVSACAVGYIGDYCSTCEEAYWRDGYRCKACADSVTSNYWHAMIAMIVFFGVVWLCCALLPLEALTKVTNTPSTALTLLAFLIY